MERSDAELAFLMAHDSDSFNRWDAGQTLATKLILDLAGQVAQKKSVKLPSAFLDAFTGVLKDTSVDEAFKAVMLSLPSETVVGQEMDVVDPDAIHAAREFIRKELAVACREDLRTIYDDISGDWANKQSQKSINRRRLKNVVLSYLSTLPDTAELLAEAFRESDNMTDTQAALSLLANLDTPLREQALTEFYDRFKDDPLVVDKWFAVQALSKRADTTEQVRRLTEHADFTVENPNRVRSLIGAYTANQVHFHQLDGAGYRLLADFVLDIEAANPQLAARLVSAFNIYRRFDSDRQSLMRSELERVAAKPKLCKDVYEIVQRALSF